MRRMLGNRTARTGFTLVELLVVISIIAVLISLLLPALAQARASAQSTVCLSNLQQVALAATEYAQDNQGRGPSYVLNPADARNNDTAFWDQMLLPYVVSTATVGNHHLSKGPQVQYFGQFTNYTLTTVFLCPTAAAENHFVHWWHSGVMNWRTYEINSLLAGAWPNGDGVSNPGEKSAPLVALFIKEAVKYRVPAHAPVNGRVKLKPIHHRTGWVIDTTKYGTADSHAMPFTAFNGDPSHASWFFNRKLAQAVNRYMVRMNRKKPELIDFVVNGKPASLKQNGFASLGAHFNPDGVTFNVQARYLNHSPTRKLLNGGVAGHANAPIKFWTIGSGALKQVGPDTFKVYLHRGGVRRQGPPWEPWIIAYSPGNSRFQSTDRPAHIWLPITNHAGKRQTIAFSSPANVKAGTKSIRLYATSSLGLPVQFFVVSGPVKLAADNRTLRFTAIPPRATFPMKVIIGAWQWGQAVHPRVQTTGPVYRSFLIDK